jgi:MoaA/NifB/PqqE/SkfB family radical SAM enzyme
VATYRHLLGDLRKQTSAEVWTNSTVLGQLREDDNRKGKCGCCEFRQVCMDAVREPLPLPETSSLKNRSACISRQPRRR